MASSRNRKKENIVPLTEETFEIDSTDTGTPTVATDGPMPEKEFQFTLTDTPEGGATAVTEKAVMGFSDEKEAVVPAKDIPPILRMEKEPTEEEIDALVEKIQDTPPVIVIPSMPGIEDKGWEDALFKESDAPSEGIYEELVRILSPQKGKRGVPTLVGFESTYARAKRYVIIDINDNLLKDAYRCWKDHDAGDDEMFLDMVYKITRTEVPRMYRTVAFLDLK